jgi:hypothetical protein
MHASGQSLKQSRPTFLAKHTDRYEMRAFYPVLAPMGLSAAVVYTTHEFDCKNRSVRDENRY